MAEVVKYTHPGGYPDPDNILGPHGTVGRVTESQARVQMVLWSIMPTQLILGEDVTQMSDEYIETVGNEELIAVNQGTFSKTYGSILTVILHINDVACCWKILRLSDRRSASSAVT